MRGTIDRDSWDVPVDLFFFRDDKELAQQQEEDLLSRIFVKTDIV